MSEYSIGTALPEHLVAVARLIDRRPDLSPLDLSQRQHETWARMMRTDNLTVYLAWRGDDAVGTTALLVMPHITYACRPTAFIESMYVRDEHRRHGVARMMVERLLDDATSAGCHKVQLLTHSATPTTERTPSTAHSGSTLRRKAFACTSTALAGRATAVVTAEPAFGATPSASRARR